MAAVVLPSASHLVRLAMVGIVVFLLLTLSLHPTSLSTSHRRYQQVSRNGLQMSLLLSETLNRTRSSTLVSALETGSGMESGANVTGCASNRTRDAPTADTQRKLDLNGTVSRGINASAIASELDGGSMATASSDGGVVVTTEPGNVGGNSNSNRSVRSLLGLREGETAYENNTQGTTATPALTTIPERFRSVTHHRSDGFILAVEYQQQLLGGFKGFYHLTRLAAALNLSIVEPFVYGTTLVGVPMWGESPRINSMKLSHFYDLFGLRKAVQYCSGVDLVTSDNFQEKASRNVVFVSFVVKPQEYFMFFGKGDTEQIIEYPSYTADSLIRIGQLNSWSARLFQFRRMRRRRQTRRHYRSFMKFRNVIVDARPLHPLSWKLLTSTLQSIVREQITQFGSTTVVIGSWRDVQPPDMISNFLYSIPDFPMDYCHDMRVVPHSKTVVDATESFIKTLKRREGPIVGVHIRAERLLIDFKGNVTHYTGCLTQLKEVLVNGTVPRVPRENIQIFHDLGKYGSQSCNRFCELGYSDFLQAINNLGYETLYFDPFILGPDIPMRKALAAFVDRDYLARVNALVTVGRGEHQNNIVDRFVLNQAGSTENLHRICNNHHPIPDCYPNC